MAGTPGGIAKTGGPQKDPTMGGLKPLARGKSGPVSKYPNALPLSGGKGKALQDWLGSRGKKAE